MSLGTKSPDNWKWISDTESFLDTQYETFSRKEKLDVIQILALFSLAFGTSNPAELFLGSAAFIPHYYIGGNGFDGMISVLSGVQIQKRKYATAAFPTLYESYKVMKDFTSGKTVTRQSLSRSVLFVVGWLAARYRYV